MPRILRNLRINEVSGVDKGAGRGVSIMLMKRDDDQIDWNDARQIAKVIRHEGGKWNIYSEDGSKKLGSYDSKDQAVERLRQIEGHKNKREFSEKERESAADSGAALPDGSFPIKNKGDLKNAIQAIGRAKNPAKAKAHIKSRARALGATDMLPDTWKRDETAALKALNESIASIIEDDDVTDKVAAIDKSISEFNEYLSDEETDMDEQQVAKMIADAVAEAAKETQAELAKAQAELKYIKMSDREKAHMDSLQDEDEKKRFNDMDEDDRKKCMDEKDKVGKRDTMDEQIAKALKAKDQEIASLQKMVGELVGDRRLADFRKRAKETGLSEEDGEIVMKAFDGDPAAGEELLKRAKTQIDALKAQVKTSVVFGEFGKTGGGSSDAIKELELKAAELRKTEKGLSPQQAFAKVYADPANAELVAREQAERSGRLRKIAAGTE